MRKLIYKSGDIEVDMGISPPFSIVSIDGLGFNNDIYTYKPLYTDGERYIDSSLNKRNIVIEMKITQDYELNLRRLIKCFSPKEQGTLVYEDGNVRRKCYCYVEFIDYGKTTRDNSFIVSLICPSPFFYGFESEIKTLAKWEPQFHFPVIYGDPDNPIIFGKRVVNKLVNLYNDGDVSTSVIIELEATAQVVNPQVTNVTTSEEFKLLTTLNAGDKIVIDTKNKRVEKNGKNAYNLRARGSKFFNLALRDNVITYQCDSGDENLDVTITFENAYVGV